VTAIASAREELPRLGPDAAPAADAALASHLRCQVEVVEWVRSRFQQAAEQASRHWTLASCIIIAVGVVVAAGPVASQAVPPPSGAGQVNKTADGLPLQTVVSVDVKPGSASERDVDQHCPALKGKSHTMTAFLLRSDDSDGKQDGPFTALLADARCPGERIVVSAGDGHYATPTPTSSATPTPIRGQ
jgi:hypothetical protein